MARSYVDGLLTVAWLLESRLVRNCTYISVPSHHVQQHGKDHDIMIDKNMHYHTICTSDEIRAGHFPCQTHGIKTTCCAEKHLLKML